MVIHSGCFPLPLLVLEARLALRDLVDDLNSSVSFFNSFCTSAKSSPCPSFPNMDFIVRYSSRKSIISWSDLPVAVAHRDKALRPAGPG
eukprot:Skav205732  [mRNA]  locus=scaffold1496:165667:168437:- [translate_table: standard]